MMFTEMGEISNHFAASKDEDLYSSVSYNHIEMSDVVSPINDRIEKFDMPYFTELTVENIITAVNQVKSVKKDRYCALSTGHFNNGPRRLYALLCMLFNSLIQHGFTPDGFNTSTIVPLVKIKGN